MLTAIDKPTLRKQMLAKRLSLEGEVRARAADAIILHILEYVPAGAVVAGYAAIKGELEVFPAMQALAARGHTLCLPDITHQHAPLTFYRWQPGEALVKGSYGIDIPKEKNISVPDILLVPLVAFDAKKNRLGYGAGYYDRSIEELRIRNPYVKAYGIGYSIQQVELLPQEPHDVQLDGIITEKGWV
jgi:5-formyltetrahydrofolate cyclo-ligase